MKNWLHDPAHMVLPPPRYLWRSVAYPGRPGPIGPLVSHSPITDPQALAGGLFNCRRIGRLIEPFGQRFFNSRQPTEAVPSIIGLKPGKTASDHTRRMTSLLPRAGDRFPPGQRNLARFRMNEVQQRVDAAFPAGTSRVARGE